MAVMAADVLTRVRTITMDTGGVFWGPFEAQQWLNEGRDLVATLKPDENPQKSSMELVSGAMQSIPSAALAFIRAVRNVGGPAIYPADRADLEAYAPLWMDTEGQWVRHVMWDEKQPRNFWIYPQPPAPRTDIEIVCSYPFTAVDIYFPGGAPNPTPTHTTVDVSNDAAMVDYVLARQYQQQNEAGAQQRAASHFQSFFTLLGMINEAKLYANPSRPVAPNIADAKGSK